ncbi:MAG TPA: MBL fold metallo-hydrolase [Dehalococcoidia bacterium]|nr:MBL fold metallo-hydrolase [Dehalococcoidia bacterium]
MQVSPSVRAVQVPDDSPMHPQFTTIYLVGRGQVLTIDSGEDAERYRWMFKGYLAATEHAEIGQSVVTHYHIDHSSNLRWLRDQFGTEVHVLEAAKPLIGERLPETGVHEIADGDEVGPGGGVKVRAVLTPGHSPDSLSYYLEDEGVLFTGDTVLGEGTTTVNDLATYLQSLKRLRSLPNLRVICPGHGPLIEDPAQRIDLYIKHRELRERQVLKALATGDAMSSWQIMELLYPDINPRLRRSADGNVRAHLSKLAKEGRITVYDGKRRDGSTAESAEAEAAEHARQEVILQADAHREEARRRALFLQENPPTAEWEEPPRYELIRR